MVWYVCFFLINIIIIIAFRVEIHLTKNILNIEKKREKKNNQMQKKTTRTQALVVDVCINQLRL
jgi:hypothetical protein